MAGRASAAQRASRPDGGQAAVVWLGGEPAPAPARALRLDVGRRLPAARGAHGPHAAALRCGAAHQARAASVAAGPAADSAADCRGPAGRLAGAPRLGRRNRRGLDLSGLDIMNIDLWFTGAPGC